MTCCIAALCDGDHGQNCKSIVVVADRMVTLGGFIEFEHKIPKITELSEYAIALSAGDALHGSKTTTQIRKKMPTDQIAISEIANMAAQIYAQNRDQQVRSNYISSKRFNKAKIL